MRMDRLRTVFILVIVVGFASRLWAPPPPRPWVSVEFDTGMFSILVTKGLPSASATLGYTATGTLDATITIEVDKIPVDMFQYTWEASLNEPVFQAGSVLTGVATVTISGLSGQEMPMTSKQGRISLTIASI